MHATSAGRLCTQGQARGGRVPEPYGCVQSVTSVAERKIRVVWTAKVLTGQSPAALLKFRRCLGSFSGRSSLCDVLGGFHQTQHSSVRMSQLYVGIARSRVACSCMSKILLRSSVKMWLHSSQTLVSKTPARSREHPMQAPMPVGRV